MKKNLIVKRCFRTKRGKRPRRRPKSKKEFYHPDITLGESADSPIPVVFSAKQSCSKNLLQKKVHPDLIDETLPKSAYSSTPVVTTRKRRLHNQTLQNQDEIQIKRFKNSEDEHTSRDYPSDLWWRLADEIAPEDIGRFSAICRAAFDVTQLASFWRKLYNRYCKHHPASLPIDLQPHAIQSSDENIRVKVIRALFIVYPPFQQRIKNGMPSSDYVNSLGLCGATCQSIEYFRCTEEQPYYMIIFENILSVEEQNLRNSLISNPVVWGNPREGEILLKVVCPQFESLPYDHVIGLQLNSVSLMKSGDISYKRLRLRFESCCDIKKQRGLEQNEINFCRVTVVMFV